MGDELDEPIGYLVLPRGTPVVTSDGVTVGKVHKVQHHERERIFDGLVVQSDEGRRFVDAPEVGHLTRRQVDLLIDSATFCDPARGRRPARFARQRGAPRHAAAAQAPARPVTARYVCGLPDSKR